MGKEKEVSFGDFKEVKFCNGCYIDLYSVTYSKIDDQYECCMPSTNLCTVCGTKNSSTKLVCRIVYVKRRVFGIFKVKESVGYQFRPNANFCGKMKDHYRKELEKHGLGHLVEWK